MVWAVPVSLAATKGIARTFFLNIMAQSTTVQELVPERDAMHLFRKKVPYIAFYSSRYWDVSLPWVRVLIQGHLPMTGRFPHSEISGSKVIWHLAETYRSHITSFIASWSLGIHHTPLHSCKERYTPLSRYVPYECCAPLHNFECCLVSEKYNNQNQTFVWFAGDEKTRQMAIVFTQQTVLPTAWNHLRDFTPLPRVRRTRVDFSEPTLSIGS